MEKNIILLFNYYNNMPKKADKKKSNEPSTDTNEQVEQVDNNSLDSDKINQILNLLDIVIEQPQIETFNTPEKCKTGFDIISINYIKLTHVLILLDNERARVVNYLSQIQKQFRQLNASKEAITNNDEIKQVIDKVLEKEEHKLEEQTNNNTETVKETSDNNHDNKDDNKDNDNDININKNDDKDNTKGDDGKDETATNQNLQANEESKKTVKKKVVTRRVVKKAPQKKDEQKTTTQQDSKEEKQLDAQSETQQDVQSETKEEAKTDKPKASKKVVVRARKTKAADGNQEPQKTTKRVVKKKTT